MDKTDASVSLSVSLSVCLSFNLSFCAGAEGMTRLVTFPFDPGAITRPLFVIIGARFKFKLKHKLKHKLKQKLKHKLKLESSQVAGSHLP